MIALQSSRRSCLTQTKALAPTCAAWAAFSALSVSAATLAIAIDKFFEIVETIINRAVPILELKAQWYECLNVSRKT